MQDHAANWYESGPCDQLFFDFADSSPPKVEDAVKRIKDVLRLSFVAEIYEPCNKLNALITGYKAQNFMEPIDYYAINVGGFLAMIKHLRQQLDKERVLRAGFVQTCKSIYQSVRHKTVEATNTLIDAMAQKALYVPPDIGETVNYRLEAYQKVLSKNFVILATH